MGIDLSKRLVLKKCSAKVCAGPFMKTIRPIYAVLLLCILSLHTLSNSLILPGYEFHGFQAAMSEQVNGTDSLTADDSYELSSDGDWKPPKHSFIDYSTFLSPTLAYHRYVPHFSKLLAYQRYQAQPQVFLDIVVPPDHV